MTEDENVREARFYFQLLEISYLPTVLDYFYIFFFLKQSCYFFSVAFSFTGVVILEKI